LLPTILARFNRRRRRKKGLSAQLRRRDAWLRVQKVLTIVVLGAAVVYLSSYLAEMAAYTELKFLTPPKL